MEQELEHSGIFNHFLNLFVIFIAFLLHYTVYIQWKGYRKDGRGSKM